MKIRIVGLLLIMASVLMTACGQKGPLFLPDKEGAAEQAAAEAEAPAAEAADATQDKNETESTIK